VTQGWRKLHNETYNLQSLPLIIRAARWAEHVERKAIENFFQMLVGEPEIFFPFPVYIAICSRTFSHCVYGHY